MNNNKIKVHIDIKQYKDKPKNFSIIKPRLQAENTIREVELSKLMNCIENGVAISPAIMHHGTKASNWSEQSLFLVDIDNHKDDEYKINLSDAIKICKENNIIPVFYYFTYNNCHDAPRFRLAFVMDEPITDSDLRFKIISTLVNLFPKADKSCTNADRIFLGTNSRVFENDLDARLTIDDILKLANQEVIDNTNYGNNELSNLKKNFDLLSYMEKDNKISRKSNDITYFENCSICGHRDCLRYYHNSNTFYCFGINGCKGGTIIDYLMITENLSLKDAINKFKYELCNVNDDREINQYEYFSAEELQNMNLLPITFFVKDLIPQGLTLICSVPKLGKSWFALQLCLAITSGQKFLKFGTNKCSCLYLALEDSKNRLKDRTTKLLGESNFPSNLYFNTNNKIISNGLISELNNFIENHEDIKVIVIDTLQKVRGISKTTNVYANDYKELSSLKTFADKYNIAIILIHHLRKGFQTTDVFDRVSGTNGITGTADTTIILSKDNREDVDTKMAVVGRDVEYNEYVIMFNKDTCKWEMKGTAEELNKFIERQEYNNNTLIKTIKQLLEDNNLWSGTFKELNGEHKKIFGCLYDNQTTKIKKDIDKIQSNLLKYDNIIYIPAKFAAKGKRIQIFKKNI